MPKPQSHRAFLSFSLLVAALFVAAAGYLGVRQGFFEPRLHLRFEIAELNGLGPGSPVTYAGYRIGVVDSVELTPAGRIAGNIAVRERYRQFFTQGSVLRVNKGKIISTELEVEVRQAGQPPLPDGAVIACDTASDTEAMARELTDRFTPLIDNLTRLTRQLADEHEGVRPILKSAHAAVASGQQALQSLHARIADPRLDASYDGLAGTLKQSEQVAAKLGATLESANALVQTTQRTVQNQDEQLRQAMHQTNQVLTDLREVSRGAADAITEVRNAPVYRLLVGQTPPPPGLPHDVAPVIGGPP